MIQRAKEISSTVPHFSLNQEEWASFEKNARKFQNIHEIFIYGQEILNKVEDLEQGEFKEITIKEEALFLAAIFTFHKSKSL